MLVAAFALLLGLSAGRFAARASAGYAGNLRDAIGFVVLLPKSGASAP